MTSGPYVAVIEDNNEIRLTVRQILEEEGYRVGEASDGLAGLQLVRDTAEPAVVLLDLTLPILSGTHIVQAVLADAALAARHAFIVFTARREGIPAELLPLPGGLWLRLVEKPFDLDVLLDAVAAAHQTIAARCVSTS